MDVKKLARFERPRPPRDRRPHAPRTCTAAIGYDYLHFVVDDHSRLAYVELHAREDADTERAHARAGARTTSPSSVSTQPRR